MRARRTDRSSLLVLALVCLAGLVAAPQASADGVLDAGSNFTCAVKTSGTPVCWGYNSSGQLNTPWNAGPFASISAGHGHACAVKRSGEPVCWGAVFSSLGETAVPPDIGTVTSVSAGSTHSCAVKTGGTPVCWGQDSYWGLVSGAATIGSVKAIEAGNTQTCAIKMDDTPHCWGNDQEGGTSGATDVGPVSKISMGYAHVCAIETDGDPVCWGRGDSGQTNIPADLGKVLDITAGAEYTCAVKVDGTPVCWGAGGTDYGQVSGAAGKGPVTGISAGAYSACAVRVDGTVVCWGEANISSPPSTLGTVGPRPPVSSSAPSVSAPVWASGQVVTADRGGWDNEPTEYHYTWLRCTSDAEADCAEIAGAQDAATYTLVADDNGDRIRVRVVAANAKGSSQPSTSPAGPVVGLPRLTGAAPSISGSIATGDTLTVAPGEWSEAPTSYDIEWLRCPADDWTPEACVTVTGEDATDDDLTYELVDDDDHSRLRVRVAGINAAGTGEAGLSEPTEVLDPLTSITPPVLTAPNTRTGDTITTTRGEWSGEAETLTVTWQRCYDLAFDYCFDHEGDGDAMDGDLTYTLTDAVDGAFVRAAVRAQNAFGESVYSYTAKTPKIDAPTNTTLPTVSGAPRTGDTLTATAGSWTGDPWWTEEYPPQWLRCSSTLISSCTVIEGLPFSTSYTLTEADSGKRIRFRERVENGSGRATADSAPTAIIDLPIASVAPIVQGTTRAGDTVTTTTGEWSGNPTRRDVEWLRCTTTLASSCAKITGSDATDGDTSYTLVDADNGKRIRSRITAHNTWGTGSSTSAPTAVVDTPTVKTAPVVSGTTRTGFTLTTTNGEWTGNPTSYSVEWLRCTTGSLETCTKVATAASYKLVDADDGKYMRSRVTARNAYAAGLPSVSAHTEEIDVPTSTVAPVVTGAARTGQVLTTTRGTWTGNPVEFWAEWYRCSDEDVDSCEYIDSEDADDGDLTYTLAAGDATYRIRSVVWARGAAAGWNADPVFSDATEVVDLPTVTLAPAVSGTTRTGFTLATTNGEWTGNPTGYSIEWLRCTDTTVGSCAPIAGAVGSSYKLVDADDGKRIRSRVVARSAGGTSAPSTSAATAVIDLPVNTVAPVVSGGTRTGQLLTTTRGTWTSSPTSYSIEWLRCADGTTGSCAKITSTDATDGDLTYTLVDADDAKRIRSRVAATNAAGTGAAVPSAATAIVDLPSVITVPVVSGTTRTGFTLASTNGDWTGDPTGFTVEWLRCTDTTLASCSRITAATSYKLVDADDGKRIRSRVTARNAGGDGAPSTSLATAVIDLPMNTVVPAVSGSPRSGQVLTTNRGTWSGTPTAYGVEWLRCSTSEEASCTKLTTTDATNDDLTYTAVAADAGKRVRSRVTATNAFGAGVPASSNATAAIDAPTNTALPAITGRTRTADTLTATTGDWTGAPTGYTIEWLRCSDTLSTSCAPITGTDATDNNTTYKLVNADDAKRIRVRVVATNANGSSAPATSTATGVIDLPAATVAPAITGTAAVGQTLTTTRGTWTGLPTSHTIEWLKCTTTSVSSCTKLTTADATNNDLTYTPAAGEAGAYLRSRVTASNAGGAGTPSTSAGTAAVTG